jgi:hypothetical protein
LREGKKVNKGIRLYLGGQPGFLHNKSLKKGLALLFHYSIVKGFSQGKTLKITAVANIEASAGVSERSFYYVKSHG